MGRHERSKREEPGAQILAVQEHNGECPREILKIIARPYANAIETGIAKDVASRVGLDGRETVTDELST